jgi:hypothetical protein
MVSTKMFKQEKKESSIGSLNKVYAFAFFKYSLMVNTPSTIT